MKNFKNILLEHCPQEKVENFNEFFAFAENVDNSIKEKGLEIAKIILIMKLDIHSVVAGFSLGIFRDGKSDLSQSSLDEETKTLISSVLKIEDINYLDKATESENLRSMFIAIAKDIRVIIIKLADVLFNARNFKTLSNEFNEKLFYEIDEIYAPISARLGLSFIKSELQDLSLEYHKPEVYHSLVEEVSIGDKKRQKQMKEVISSLTELLVSLNIKGAVKGRIKHISSIYKKITEKHYALSNIYDILAVRVLVNSVNECYAVLGAVHTLFAPIDGRFKDYVARPKQNGYQSLHTTVLVDNEPLEIQIRTFDMHNHAEYGIAAHWMYKEHKSKTSSLDEKLVWIRKMIEDTQDITAESIVESLKTDIYSGEIFVQSPQGKIVELPEDSTPLDFAYNIHSDVGNKCVGAKVNGKIVPITSTLNNGDVVEIITNVNAKGPSRDWLKHVKSSSARNKINAFFKKEMKEENIKRGKSILDQSAKAKNLSLSKLINKNYIGELLEKYSLKSEDEMYAAVGYGSLTSAQVLTKLINIYNEHNEDKEIVTKSIVMDQNTVKDLSSINELSNMMVKFAHCCSPIPGDEIVGFVSRGKGVTIHKADCPTLLSLEKDRVMKLTWSDNISDNFVANIEILCENKTGLLADISAKFSELKLNISSFNTRNLKDGFMNLSIGVSIEQKKQLTELINKLNNIPQVIKVERKV